MPAPKVMQPELVTQGGERLNGGIKGPHRTPEGYPGVDFKLWSQLMCWRARKAGREVLG